MRLLFLLLIGIVALPADCVRAAEQRHVVMMLLYRGMTDAERGFIEYLKPRLPVDFVIRDSGGDRAKIAEFIAEARARRPALIYSFGTTVTIDAVGAAGKIDPARHITDIPVVFNIVADPVGAGLATGYVATGRNVTGVSHLVPMEAQLRTMQRVKRLRQVGVIFNLHEPNSMLAVQDLRRHAKPFGYTLVEAPLATARGQKVQAEETADAMRRLVLARPDVIYLPSDSSLIPRAGAIVALATEADIPVLSATEAPIREGGALLGLVAAYYNAGSYAGYKAEQILTGKRAVSTIPVDTLQRFTLLINMKTAARLSLYPPMDLVPIAELLH